MYWGEINQSKRCPDEGCYEEFETLKDLECHIRYHCGNEPNPFTNTTRPGNLDRRTLHGYGIPPEDIKLFGNKILFGRTQMTWNCMICGYKGNQYEWRQVYGHVRATHCYESRIPNERWNIPLEEQHKTSKKKEQISAIHLEILLGRIREKQGEGDKIWECIQCEESYRAEKEIFGHIGKKTSRNNNRQSNLPILLPRPGKCSKPKNSYTEKDMP